MFFRRKKDKDRDRYDDPAARYGRIPEERDEAHPDRPGRASFWSRLFGTGHDSDFVYYDD